MSLILWVVILINLRLVERVIFIFHIKIRFIIYLWTIEWCLPIFVVRFGWAWRANRLLTALSAFCFCGFILFSVTFRTFSRINCVLHVCFFCKTRIRKLTNTYLVVKKTTWQSELQKRLRLFLGPPSRILFFDEAASSFAYYFATKQASPERLRL